MYKQHFTQHKDVCDSLVTSTSFGEENVFHTKKGFLRKHRDASARNLIRIKEVRTFRLQKGFSAKSVKTVLSINRKEPSYTLEVQPTCFYTIGSSKQKSPGAW